MGFKRIDEPAGRFRLVEEKPDEPSFTERMIQRETNDLSSGLRRGLKDVIDTGAELLAKGYDKVTGEKRGEFQRVKQMNDAGKAAYHEQVGENLLPHFQRFAGNVLGTVPFTQALGGVIGAGSSPLAQSLGSSIASGGMSAGGALGPAATMASRIAGGATNGYVSAGLIDPNQAGTGAVIGGALPPALRTLGAAGSAMARLGQGPTIPAKLEQAVRQAQGAGYVIPPTQANPTAVNRAAEGLAGKISTAQNASARNQSVSNDLARQSVGAESLTPEGLASVRNAANRSYDALAQAPAFKADDAFRTALERAGGGSKELRQFFPELANKEIDSLVAGMAGREEFGAPATIEAIKRLRFEGSGNKSVQDPGKRALGSAQMKVAGALEDLIDRNLQTSGSQELLTGYRNARTTLAKVYDIEKALNTSSGNVDAAKLVNALKKGKTLTGELKTIADFAAAFPKAAQLPERMGSLPQVSPMDFAAVALSGAAGGGAGSVLGLAARPLARNFALSPRVQNGLLSDVNARPGRGLLDFAADDALPLLYRGAPLTGTSQ